MARILNVEFGRERGAIRRTAGFLPLESNLRLECQLEGCSSGNWPCDRAHGTVVPHE